MTSGAQQSDRVRQLREEIYRIASEHGASDVRLFGSVPRGEVHPGSDIDFLVDMAPDRSLLDRASLKIALESLLGYPVDVVTPNSIKTRYRQLIIDSARPL